MNEAIKTLVALDTNVSYEMIQAALPVDTSVQVVGMVEGLDEAWNTLQETNADLLIYRDREGARREAMLDHSGVATAVAVLMLAFALAEAVGRRRQPLGQTLNFVATSPLHRA